MNLQKLSTFFLLAMLSAPVPLPAKEPRTPESMTVSEEGSGSADEKIKALTWEGEVGKQKVKLVLKSGLFKEADFKAGDSSINGYPFPSIQFLQRGATYLLSCEMVWDGKKVELKQAPFNSTLWPKLAVDPDPNTFTTASVPENFVKVYPSDEGDSIMVTVPCPTDGATTLVAFTITREGKVYRSTVGLSGG